MPNVLLLREPSEDGHDRYEVAFLNAGYHPVSIHVLETIYTNLQMLQDTIHEGPQETHFNGVIITSKKSCEAWKEALQQLRSTHSVGRTLAVAGWCHIPFYVVGEATAAALREVFDDFRDLGLTSIDVRGQSSGSAASLAAFILEDLKPSQKQKLFYLTGDKNRDTITYLLTEGGVELEPLQVYKTRGSSSFAQDLLNVLASPYKDAKFWWIIYFAPSAAAFVTPLLREHFNLKSDSDKPTLIRSKIAVIGPTTRSFLQDELHLNVDVMAQKPTPEDIVSAIQTYDSESES